MIGVAQSRTASESRSSNVASSSLGAVLSALVSRCLHCGGSVSQRRGVVSFPTLSAQPSPAERGHSGAAASRFRSGSAARSSRRAVPTVRCSSDASTTLLGAKLYANGGFAEKTRARPQLCVAMRCD